MTTPREWLQALRRLFAGPVSLERSLALTIGGLLLVAIVALASSAIGLLRDQAEEQALARVQLAGVTAREELRRNGEDALTSARVLAVRPALQRLIRGGNREQTELFLRRFCELARLDACAVLAGDTLLGVAGRPLPWAELLQDAQEQGERFTLAPPFAPDGLLGATAPMPNQVNTRVVVLRFFDDRLARSLGEQVGMEIRLARLSDWLEAVHPDFKELHSTAIASTQTAAAYVGKRDLYASSTPVIASTGEGVALIEARLPASEVKNAVGPFVHRLVWTAVLLGGLALVATLLLARRIVRPLQALSESAASLGRGDFSTSIPVAGAPEVAALARTMDDMRRNLVDLTATLRRSEAEAKAMLQGVVEGVFAVDANRSVRYLNSQAASMLGVAADQVLGRFCGDVLRPCAVEGRPPCETCCPILQARRLGQSRATERLQASDGSIRTVVITSAGAVDGLQVQVMRDETELEAVRRARDSILANISHEFRTPLAAQLASIELLKDGLAGMPRAELEELVDALQRGTLRLTRLIDNLLESVRIESGQLGIRRQEVSLHEIVEDAGEFVAALLTQRSQSLEIALPEALPAIQADATRLTQVLVNLLANAIKFGPEGGRVYVGGRLEDGNVHLWVEDEGPGVPDLDRGSIFERFYRASDQEPEPRGLGLGLWIVKSIVERHGGRVEAARTDAGRTRFTVVLPVGEAGE